MSKIKGFFASLQEKVMVLYENTLYTAMISGGDLLLSLLLFYLQKKVLLYPYPYVSEGLFILSAAVLGGAVFAYLGNVKAVIISDGVIYKPLKFNRYWGIMSGVPLGLLLIAANMWINGGTMHTDIGFFSSNALALTFFLFYTRRRFKKNILQLEKYYMANAALFSGNIFLWLTMLLMSR